VTLAYAISLLSNVVTNVSQTLYYTVYQRYMSVQKTCKITEKLIWDNDRRPKSSTIWLMAFLTVTTIQPS
jgi:hypothetical protein